MKYLIPALILLATSVSAQEQPSTQTQCESLLQAYSVIEVKAAQSKLVSDVQQGVAQVCRGLLKAEKDLKDLQDKEKVEQKVEEPKS